MYPVVTRTNAVNQVIADKTVQGVTAIPEILIVLTSIFRIRLVINLLGITLEVVKIIDAMSPIDRVGLNKSRELEVAMVRIPRLTLFGSSTVVGRTIRHLESLTSDSRVWIDGVGLVATVFVVDVDLELFLFPCQSLMPPQFCRSTD